MLRQKHLNADLCTLCIRQLSFHSRKDICYQGHSFIDRHSFLDGASSHCNNKVRLWVQNSLGAFVIFFLISTRCVCKLLVPAHTPPPPPHKKKKKTIFLQMPFEKIILNKINLSFEEVMMLKWIAFNLGQNLKNNIDLLESGVITTSV